MITPRCYISTAAEFKFEVFIFAEKTKEIPAIPPAFSNANILFNVPISVLVFPVSYISENYGLLKRNAMACALV